MKTIYCISLAFFLAACNQDVQAPKSETDSATSAVIISPTKPVGTAAKLTEGQTTCADVFADLQTRGVPRVIAAKDALPSGLADSVSFSIPQRVADGKEASRSEAEGIVGVGKTRWGATCTGTLINDRWVLTAAHCGMHLKGEGETTTYEGGTSVGWVFVGSTSKSVDASGQPRRGTFLCHPGFEPNLQNDIALIHLDKPITDEPTVSVPARSDPPMSRRALEMPMMVFGFGATNYNSTTDTDKGSSVLRIGIVKLALQRCGNQPSKTFCSLTTGESGKANVGLCRGDSGGPLFIDPEGNGTLRQFGVNSFMSGGKCGEPNVYSGFVDVSRHLDWIAKVTGLPF